MAQIPLTRAHRTAVTARLRAIDESIATLRALRVDPAELDELEGSARETAVTIEAGDAVAQPSLVAATVAQILIAATEIDPEHLHAYGELDPDAARYLAEASTRLLRLAYQVGGVFEDPEPRA